MKVIFLYCFLYFNIYLINAQEIVYQVIVLDKDFESPIENSNITVFKTKENFVSNKEGIVKFGLKGSSFIEIAHQDYKSQKIRIASNSPQEIKVLLVPRIKQLEEVIVTQKHPQDILKSVIKNSKEKLSLPANLKVYIKEFYKYNGDYSFFCDGLLNFQIYKFLDGVKTDILIEQSRAIGLKKPYDEEIWGYNLNAISEKQYSFGYLSELLEKKSKKEYHFILKNHPTENSFNIIEIKPLEEIDKLLYAYKVTFHAANKIIHEIEIYIPENKENVFISNKDSKNRLITKMNITQKYAKKDKEYYLLNSSENIEYWNKTSNKDVKIEVKNTMHTVRFYDFLFEYKNRELFKNKSLILTDKNTILTNYWEYQSGVYLNDEEHEILNFLQLLTPKQ